MPEQYPAMTQILHIMSDIGYWDEVVLMAPVVAMGAGVLGLLVYAIKDTNKRRRQ